MVLDAQAGTWMYDGRMGAGQSGTVVYTCMCMYGEMYGNMSTE